MTEMIVTTIGLSVLGIALRMWFLYAGAGDGIDKPRKPKRRLWHVVRRKSGTAACRASARRRFARPLIPNVYLASPSR